MDRFYAEPVLNRVDLTTFDADSCTNPTASRVTSRRVTLVNPDDPDESCDVGLAFGYVVEMPPNTSGVPRWLWIEAIVNEVQHISRAVDGSAILTDVQVQAMRAQLQLQAFVDQVVAEIDSLRACESKRLGTRASLAQASAFLCDTMTQPIVNWLNRHLYAAVFSNRPARSGIHTYHNGRYDLIPLFFEPGNIPGNRGVSLAQLRRYATCYIKFVARGELHEQERFELAMRKLVGECAFLDANNVSTYPTPDADGGAYYVPVVGLLTDGFDWRLLQLRGRTVQFTEVRTATYETTTDEGGEHSDRHLDLGAWFSSVDAQLVASLLTCLLQSLVVQFAHRA